MRLKSFHGNNLSEAMRLVRDALGENAIIVATRDDDAGGVRVTAAIDEVPPEPQASQRQSPSAPAVDYTADDGSAALELIAEALTRHQVAAPLAEKLMSAATQYANEDPVLALGAAFDVHYQFAPLVEDKTNAPTILVGPPGAGKTLSIAKLATKAALAKRAVTVITTDLDRAGATEQLAAFTRLLKLNLVEIEDAHALQDMIAMQKGHQILVDTPGINAFDDQDRKRLAALIAACGGEATLVMPAGLDAADAVDMAHEFRALGAIRLLPTRLDMTRRLGGLLRIAADARLAFANYSAANRVVDPLLPINPVVLAKIFLPQQVSANTTKAEDRKPTVQGGRKP